MDKIIYHGQNKLKYGENNVSQIGKIKVWIK